MAAARFLLVSGWTPAGSRTPGWPLRSRLVGTAAADGTWATWRLLGANNRELGRSAAVMPGTPEVVAAIVALRTRLADAVVTHGTDERGWWGWRLAVDDVPVAVSSRAYLRQREAQYSLVLFLAAAGRADPLQARGARLPVDQPFPLPRSAGAGDPDELLRVGVTARPVVRVPRRPVPRPVGRLTARPLLPGRPRPSTSGAA